MAKAITLGFSRPPVVTLEMCTICGVKFMDAGTLVCDACYWAAVRESNTSLDVSSRA